MHIIITNHNCNLNCSYCYEHHKANVITDANAIRKYVRYVYNADKSENLRFLLIGGEPLLNPDAIEIVAQECERLNTETGQERSYRISMTCNGTLLVNSKVQEMLTKYREHIRLGFSIDGTKDIHDRCRRDCLGKGTYDRVIEGYHIARKILPLSRIYAKATLSAQDMSRWSEAVLNLIQEGFTTIIANYVAEQNFPLEMSEQLFNQFATVTDYLFEHDLYDKVHVLECSYSEDLLQNINFELEHFPNPCCSMCGTPQKAFSCLGFDGKVYPCHRFAVRGCSCTGHLKDGYIDGTNQPLIDCIEKFHSLSAEKCRDCDLRHLCTRCIADVYDLNNGVIPADNKIQIYDRCGWTQAQVASWLYFKQRLRALYGVHSMDGYLVPSELVEKGEILPCAYRIK